MSDDKATAFARTVIEDAWMIPTTKTYQRGGQNAHPERRTITATTAPATARRRAGQRPERERALVVRVVAAMMRLSAPRSQRPCCCTTPRPARSWSL
jgi:hypothetical protein